MGLVVAVVVGMILTRRMSGLDALQRGASRLGVPSLVNNLQPLIHNLLQRLGAARTQHQVQDLAAPAATPGGAPADAAASPADSAVEPTDTAVEPAGTALASAETAGA